MSATPTGNGFGFAVYSPQAGAVTRFYPHPYRFASQNPANPHGDGPQTTNLVKRLAWHESSQECDYLADSHVIESAGERYFMPFGLKRSVLVTSNQADRSQLELEWAPAVESRQQLSVEGREVQLVSFKQLPEKAVVVPLDEHGTAILSLNQGDDLKTAVHELVQWQAGADSRQLAGREAAELEKWRCPEPAGLSADESHLWRQGETVLRMAQVREASAHGKGLILASLPDGEWYIPWARDMSYATVALARMGHQAEARQALDAYLDARPMGVNKPFTRNDDYQISTVRYNGDGSESADSSGQASPNLEFDSWGLALWAAGEYMQKYHDLDWLRSPTYRGSVYENLRDYVAAPLMDNLDPYKGGLLVGKDTSIWEQNDLPAKHYAASTLCAIQGLRQFRALAETMQDGATLKAVDEKLALLQKGFNQAFVRAGRVHGVLEKSPKNDVDAATLEAINFGVAQDPAVVRATLDSMAALHEPSGGYRRVTGDTSYEKHEFVWSDFAMARALLKEGQPAPAQALVDRTVSRSKADHNLIPEMYVSVPDNEFPGQVGDPTGAIPMVGYGAGVYAITLLDRASGAGLHQPVEQGTQGIDRAGQPGQALQSSP